MPTTIPPDRGKRQSLKQYQVVFSPGGEAFTFIASSQRNAANKADDLAREHGIRQVGADITVVDSSEEE